MKYELIMLRQFNRARKWSKSLTREVISRAVYSYGYELANAGSVKQIADICDKIRLRDELHLFCRATADALSAMDKGERALLVKVYINMDGADKLAYRYGVSRSTVYRKLYDARRQFAAKLCLLGYDEKWFEDTYLKYDFAAEHVARATVLG